MTKVALHEINSFGYPSHVPSSEQVYVLSGSQLQTIIENAIDKATEPLKVEIERLWQAYDKLAQDAAFTNQRVKKLEYKEPHPLQKDRADMLRALILASGGKLPEKMARQKMHLSKQLFTYLLASMEDIELRPLETDRRHKLLVLK
jgi:hypothetical protein